MGSSLGITVARDPSLSGHFDDLFPTLEQLVEAGDRARALLSSPDWGVLAAVLGAEIAKIDRELDGKWKEPFTQAEFAGRHGRRGGLTAPERALYLLIDRAETRLAEQRAKHEQDDGSGESLPERG